MNRKRSFILLLVFIAVFGAGFAALKIFNGAPKGDETVALPVPKDPAELCIEYGQDATRLALIDGEWVNEDDENFPLKESAVRSLCGKLRSLTAARRVDSADGSSYGLDEPQCRVTVTDADETQFVYTVGSYNDYVGQYYLETGGKVYLMEEADAKRLMISAYDLLDADEPPEIDPGSISSLSVRSDSGKWYYDLFKTEDGYVVSGTLADSSDPGAMIALDPAEVKAMLKSFTLLYFYDCVEYKVPDAQTLEEYGLDNPVASVGVLYTDKGGEEQSYIVYFGAQTGSYIYARMEGSDMIFTAYTAEAKSFISPDFGAMKAQ